MVAYDRAAGELTVVRDSNFRDPAHPRFDILPAVRIRVPVDPNEMGPAPAAGGLLAIDRAGRRLVTYDAVRGELASVAYTPVRESSDVEAAEVRGKTFPVIDRAARTITVYDPVHRTMVTFAASGAQLALPPDTWRAGDEVRYYYRQPGQAVRLMNVTKTDLQRAGE